MEINHHWDERPSVNYVLISGISEDEKRKLEKLFEKAGMPISGILTPPMYPAKGKTYEHLFRFVNRPLSEDAVKDVLYKQLRQPEVTEKTMSSSSDNPVSDSLLKLLELNGEEFKQSLNEHHNSIRTLIEKSNTYEDSLRTVNDTLSMIAESISRLENSVSIESEARQGVESALVSRIKEMDDEFEKRLGQVIEDSKVAFTGIDRLMDKVLSPDGVNQAVSQRVSPPKIVITGQCSIHRDAIEKIVKEILSQKYSDIQRERNLFIFTDKDFNNKNMGENAVIRIRKGVDYVITGPGAHSVRGKAINGSLKDLSPSVIHEFRDKGTLSLSFLTEKVELILKNHEIWKTH